MHAVKAAVRQSKHALSAVRHCSVRVKQPGSACEDGLPDRLVMRIAALHVFDTARNSTVVPVEEGMAWSTRLSQVLLIFSSSHWAPTHIRWSAL